MGCGASQGKTAPAAVAPVSIVPVEPVVQPKQRPGPGNLTLPGVAKALPSGWQGPGLDAVLPNGWQMKRTIRTLEVKEGWTQHCKALPPIEDTTVALAVQPPLQVALNVMPFINESYWEFPVGEVVLGRFTIVSRTRLWPDLDVADKDSGTAYVLKTLTASSDQVLQALARSKIMEQSGDTAFLRLIDAVVGYDARCAIVEEKANATLRVLAWNYTGGELMQTLSDVASAVLSALGRLHGVGCVHTDLSLDSIVFGVDGSWKIAGMLQMKQQRQGGSGVIPRPALSGRLRPLEVLLGCFATELCDIFDLGVALVEAATGSFLLAPSPDARPPTLYDELGILFKLLGPIPMKLAEKCPGIQGIYLPWGLYLRPLGQYFGCDDVLEVVQPPAADPKDSLASLLASGRLESGPGRLVEFRSFAQKLLSLDPKQRCSPKEALEDCFFTGGGKEVVVDKKHDAALPSKVHTAVQSKGQIATQDTKSKAGPHFEDEYSAHQSHGGSCQVVACASTAHTADTADTEELLKAGEDALAEEPKHVGFQADDPEAAASDGGNGERSRPKRQQTAYVKSSSSNLSKGD